MVGATRSRSVIAANVRNQRNAKTTAIQNIKARVPKKTKSDDENNPSITRLKPKVVEKTKRAIESSPKDAPAKKRSAFGDITNAKFKQANGIKKPVKKSVEAKKSEVEKEIKAEEKIEKSSESINLYDSLESCKDKTANTSSFENISTYSLSSDSELCKLSSDGLTSSQEFTTSSRNVTIDESHVSENESKVKDFDEPIVIPEAKKVLPEGVRDVDTDPDPYSVSEYAESIFKNMKAREKMFTVKKYMEGRDEMTPSMRSVLVDWLVEVQENFELYHETLYLGVRIMDLYLQENSVPKHQLQLIGATAMLISAKIEERYPPPLDDFVFICDDAYKATDFIKTEIKILKTLKFELGIPISYRFLRRYSRVAGAEMETLTLARYILESSLLHYEFVDCPQSKIAAAALNLAFCMKKCNEWDQTLVYHTGYREEELKQTIVALNKIITEQPKSNLTTVLCKYSHPVFSEVAKIPKITIEE